MLWRLHEARDVDAWSGQDASREAHVLPSSVLLSTALFAQPSPPTPPKPAPVSGGFGCVLARAWTNAACAQKGGPKSGMISYAALFAFLGPCIASLLTSDVMSIVDTSVVGRFGSTLELAALAPAALIADTSISVFNFMSVATISLVASALARGHFRAGFEAASNAQFLAAAMGLVITVLVQTRAASLLALVLGRSATPAVLVAALIYLRVRLVGIPFALVSMVSQSALQASKDSLSPLLGVAGGAVLNVGLDIVACIYLRTGIVGAAIATLAAQIVQCALLVLALSCRQRDLSPETPRTALMPPSAAVLCAFLSFAGPLFLVNVCKSLCFNMTTAAVTSSGLLALAAHQVLITIFYVCCKVGTSIAQTIQAFLPASLGADGEVTAATHELASRLVIIAAGCGLLTATAASLVASLGGAVFTPDPSVVAAIASMSPLLGACLAIHSLIMLGEGVLFAQRDFAFLVGGYALNIFVFVSGLLVVKARALGLRAVWTALALFHLVRFCQFFLRAAAIGVVPIPYAARLRRALFPPAGRLL